MLKPGNLVPEPVKPMTSPHEFTDQPGADLGWGGFDRYNDWGTTQSTWDGTFSQDIQKVVVSGQKMTEWEKLAYDVAGYGSFLGASLDSALNTALDRGYITYGYAEYVGITVTLDAHLNAYLGVTTGAGPIVAAGLTPTGVSQSEFLSGWSAGGALPGTGVGLVTTGQYTQPVVGMPGMGISYNINVFDTASNFASSFNAATHAVLEEATRWFAAAMGLPGSNKVVDPYPFDNLIDHPVAPAVIVGMHESVLA